MIAVVILGVVLALAMPNYRSWIQNTKIRNTTESMLNGLQVARLEAVKRNASVQFDLRTGAAWSVCTRPTPAGNCPDPDDATTIQSRAVSEGSSGSVIVTPNDAAPYVFNSFGKMISPVPGVGNSTQLDVSVDTAVLQSADQRPLRVTIDVGGNTRMCDPYPGLAATDPRKCP